MTKRADAFKRSFAALIPLVVVDAREDLARARAALGHCTQHVGLAASLAWQTCITPVWDLLDTGPTNTLRRRVGLALLCLNFNDWTFPVRRRLQGCACDSRNPAVCSAGEPFEHPDERYSWCSCALCHGPALVGIGDMAVAGDGGCAMTGDRGVAIAGYGGSVAAGEGGVIVGHWFDPHTRRRRLAVGYVGEGSVEADKVYRLNERGEFFEEKPGSDQAVGQRGNTGGET